MANPQPVKQTLVLHPRFSLPPLRPLTPLTALGRLT